MKNALLILLCLLMSVSMISCGQKDISSDVADTGADLTATSQEVGTTDNTEQTDSLNRVTDEYIPTDPVSKDTEITLEGETEKITLTQFSRDGYSLWYDTTYFYLLNEDGDEKRITVYGRYDDIGSVSMTVTTNSVSADTAADNLSKALANNLMEVKSLEKSADAQIEGTLHLMAETAPPISSEYENFFGDLADEVNSVYFVPNGSNSSYTVFLCYPAECAEGYGARLEAMFREITFHQ